MFNRTLSALTWPGRKLIGLERQGRVVWSLMAVDAASLGMWLFALNSFIFHRAIGEDDYSIVVGLTLACHAVCLQYGLRQGRPLWHCLAKTVLGQALAAAFLHHFAQQLGVDLSGRQIIKLYASYFPVLLFSRLAYLMLRRVLPRAPLECVRLVLLVGAGLFLLSGRYVSSAGPPSGDAYWYSLMISDFVKQWRAGIFPVFVGQSEYAFNGAVNPLRYAPCLQHLAGLVDLCTGRSLPFPALQNLTLLLCGIGGILSAYFCAAAILPAQRWTALALGALYLACPGVLALGYEGDLFMSMTTLPFVPIVCYGLWRTLQDDRTSIAWTVLPLAAVWFSHPPIALWLTFAAVAEHATIGFRRWRDPSLYRWWGKGLALFVMAGGYTFVSVATLGLPRTTSSVDVILENIRAAFPDVLQPVQTQAGAPGNFQLGWTLTCLFLLGMTAWAFRPRRSEGVLLFSAGWLILLLTPIPRLNSVIWRAIPQTVRDITYHGPSSRFCVIIAAFIVTAAAGTAAKLGTKRFVTRAIAAVLLAIGVNWSFSEACTFVFRAPHNASVVPPRDIFMEPNDLILTRYAFNVFPAVPPYFSHGYMDPYLENQVLAADQKTVLASNLDAMRPAGDKPIQLTAYYDGDRVVVLSPQFQISPGVRYAAHFVPSSPPAAGSLLIVGPATQRMYFMPDSSMGMLHAVPTNAFGFTATSRDFFPIWTLLPEPETIGIRYIFNERPTTPIAHDFARLTLHSYTIESLPIKVLSWIPYHATASAPDPGAWLETPRMYLPGYAATANGRTAMVSKSPGGLVEVGLQPGNNDVILSYPGPWPLRASYWLALLTWAAALAIFAVRACQRLLSPPLSGQAC